MTCYDPVKDTSCMCLLVMSHAGNSARGTSFKNILKSLAERHQQLMAYTLHYNTSFASVTVQVYIAIYNYYYS